MLSNTLSNWCLHMLEKALVLNKIVVVEVKGYRPNKKLYPTIYTLPKLPCSLDFVLRKLVQLMICRQAWCYRSLF